MHNFQLFMPLIAIIGVAGIATSPRVVIAAAVVAGIGLAVPHVVDGDGNLERADRRDCAAAAALAHR